MLKNTKSRFAHRGLRFWIAAVILTTLAAIMFPVAAMHDDGKKIPLSAKAEFNKYSMSLVNGMYEFTLTDCRAGKLTTDPQLNGKYNVKVTNESGGANAFDADVEFKEGDGSFSYSGKIGLPGKVSVCLPKPPEKTKH